MDEQITVEPGSHEWIMAQADRLAAGGESSPRQARDPVNQPMINNWVEAIGDDNPAYGEGVAPPAMAQVWTMGGLNPKRDPSDPLYATMAMLDLAGFTSVIATNCEQSYDRYLRIGDEVGVTTLLESVVGPKETAVGEGYFVTTRSTWYVDENRVASMMFRVLKFRPPAPAPPAPGPEAAAVVRPMVNRDNEFFWEGNRVGELRIQKCGSCGALRHPPGPMCPRCNATDPSYVVASGRGTVYSYVVHRHPPVPGKDLPIVLALVELDEGVRMVGELLDASPDEVEIGAPVEVAMVTVDDDVALPAWRRTTGVEA